MTANARFCAILIDEMKTLEIMKTHVVHTSPESNLGHAVDLMDLYQIPVLPVVTDDGHICGMIAETNILQALQDRLTGTVGTHLVAMASCSQTTRRHLNLADVGIAARDARVADYMTSPAPTVSEDQDVADIVPLLLADVARVFVLDSNRRVVGTVGRIDLFQAAFEGVL